MERITDTIGWLMLGVLATVVIVAVLVGGSLLLIYGVHEFVRWFRTVKLGKRTLRDVQASLSATEHDLLTEKRERERAEQLLQAAMARVQRLERVVDEQRALPGPVPWPVPDEEARR